jgi:hypothetical protein
LIQTQVEISELVVVQFHGVQDRGVQIANVCFVSSRSKTKFIRGTNGLDTLHPRASQSHAKVVPVVVAARFVDAFAGWRAAEQIYQAQARKVSARLPQNLTARLPIGRLIWNETGARDHLFDVIKPASKYNVGQILNGIMPGFH